MKKTDFIKKVYEEGSFKSKVEAEHAVNTVFDTIVDVLKSGDSVKITSFGTFDVKEVKARKGKVPGKDEEYFSEAHNAPRFKYSDTVKAIVK